MTEGTSPGVLSSNLVPLESVLCTDELDRRPSRPPDYETENRACYSFGHSLTPLDASFRR